MSRFHKRYLVFLAIATIIIVSISSILPYYPGGKEKVPLPFTLLAFATGKGAITFPPFFPANDSNIIEEFSLSEERNPIPILTIPTRIARTLRLDFLSIYVIFLMMVPLLLYLMWQIIVAPFKIISANAFRKAYNPSIKSGSILKPINRKLWLVWLLYIVIPPALIFFLPLRVVYGEGDSLTLSGFLSIGIPGIILSVLFALFMLFVKGVFKSGISDFVNKRCPECRNFNTIKLVNRNSSKHSEGKIVIEKGAIDSSGHYTKTGTASTGKRFKRKHYINTYRCSKCGYEFTREGYSDTIEHV